MSFPSAGQNPLLGAVQLSTIQQATEAVGVPGIDDWKARPRKEHPRPVVMVHGTFGNAKTYWTTTAPIVAANGFLVYRLDYGALPQVPLLHGLDSVEKAAHQLSDFVDKVLASTGASKVDIVGHSQGGMMPRYYLKFLGGASKVDQLIAISPSNHGMAENEMVTLAKQFPGASELLGSTMPPACRDQIIGSELMTKLNSGGETVPGVRYTVIASKFDEVVTPFSSSWLDGPNVRNVLLQDLYPTDLSEHIVIAGNPMVFREVIKQLNS